MAKRGVRRVIRARTVEEMEGRIGEPAVLLVEEDEGRDMERRGVEEGFEGRDGAVDATGPDIDA